MGQATVGRRQGAGLLTIAAACAVVAIVAHPGAQTGLLAVGIGLLAASAWRPWSLLLPGLAVTPFALVNVLWSLGAIPTAYLFGAYIVAAALVMAAANLAARRGLVGPQPWTPALLVGAIGLLVLGTALPGRGPAAFYAWFTSWWMPAVVLGGLGAWRVARGGPR